jgi:hypothetical protein
MGGVGVAFLDTNEQRPQTETRGGRPVVVHPNFEADSPAIVGMIGAGIEYFLNHHVSVGLTVPLHLYSYVVRCCAGGALTRGTASLGRRHVPAAGGYAP